MMLKVNNSGQKMTKGLLSQVLGELFAHQYTALQCTEQNYLSVVKLTNVEVSVEKVDCCDLIHLYYHSWPFKQIKLSYI